MSKTQNLTEFHAWLVRELNKRSWSRQTLSERAGVYPSVIAKIWNGEVGLGPDVARKIAAALSVSQVQVFRLAGLIDEDVLGDEVDLGEIRRGLAQITDPGDRERVLNMVAAAIWAAAGVRGDAVVGQPVKPGTDDTPKDM